MNSKAALGLSAGALVVGLLAGLALGGGDDKPTKGAGPGPTTTLAGVPIGYERSKSGAASAATNFESHLGLLSRPGAQGRDEAVAVMASPETREALSKAVKDAGDVLDKLGSDGVVRNAVVGYVFDEYSDDQATVSIWEVSVVGDEDSVPVQAAWRTVTLRLRWVQDDWKLLAIDAAVPGPTPKLQGDTTDSTELIRKLRGQEDLKYVPLR